MNRQEKLQDALEWVETLQENYGGQEETQDLAEALGVAAEAIKAAQADTLNKIRAEIEKLNPVDYGSMYSYERHNGARDMKQDVLETIDEYIKGGAV